MISCQYVADIFFIAQDEKKNSDLKNIWEKFSVLKFSIENNVDGKPHFLDVMVNNENHQHLYKKDIKNVWLWKITLTLIFHQDVLRQTNVVNEFK